MNLMYKCYTPKFYSIRVYSTAESKCPQCHCYAPAVDVYRMLRMLVNTRPDSTPNQTIAINEESRSACHIPHPRHITRLVPVRTHDENALDDGLHTQRDRRSRPEAYEIPV